jgi:hypothetical protein
MFMEEGELGRTSEIIAQAMDHPAISQHSKEKARKLRLALETQLSPEQMERLATGQSDPSLQMIAARLQNGQV